MKEIDRYLMGLRQKIAAHGWAIQSVLPSPGSPPFQYTLGLWPQVEFEIMVIGLSHRAGSSLLNDLASRVVAGTRFTNGQVLTDVLDHGYEVTLVDVANAGTWIAMAEQLYRHAGTPLRVWQVVYPDAAHRMPWDPGYNGTGQPVLASPPRPGNPSTAAE
jgi:hypothetical protein